MEDPSNDLSFGTIYSRHDFCLHKWKHYPTFLCISWFNDCILFNEGNLLRALLNIYLFYNIYYLNKFIHKKYFWLMCTKTWFRKYHLYFLPLWQVGHIKYDYNKTILEINGLKDSLFTGSLMRWWVKPPQVATGSFLAWLRVKICPCPGWGLVHWLAVVYSTWISMEKILGYMAGWYFKGSCSDSGSAPVGGCQGHWARWLLGLQ